MIATAAFQKIGARLSLKKVPECDKFKRTSNSQDFFKCYVRYESVANFHNGGTCRMGNSKDPRSVVDSKLRVLGVNRLRVVDASIQPLLVNSFPAASIIMTAEKASAEIIKQYRPSSSTI